MGNQIKEIRNIMDDINEIISESYVFGQKPDPNQQRMRPQENIQVEGDTTENEVGIGEYEQNQIDSLDQEENIQHGKSSIDGEVNEIRKIAIRVLLDLEPTADPEAYKMIKGIWDSCDKFLVKDPKQNKVQNNNNN